MSTPDAVRAPDQEELPTTELLPPTPPLSGRRSRLSRRRVIVAAVVVVALGGAGIGTWLGTSGGGSSTGLQVTTQVVTVSTGTMRQTVATSGTIQPAQQADLSFAVSGRVTAVDVSVGQQVTAGQALATVDPTALQDQVAAAQAQLAAAQAKLSSDQANSASTSQIDADQAAVTSAQAQLTNAQTNLADATLASTINGTVAAVNLTVGQQVSAGATGSGNAGSANAGSGNGGSGNGGSGASPGSAGTGASSAAGSAANSSSSASSAQVVVVSTNAFTVATTVDDTEIGQVQVGDQAVILPTGSTTPVYGTVSSVGLVASSSGSSGVAAFPVDIAVTGTPGGLYAGATATVSIIVKVIPNAVEVPTAAISYASGQPTVTKVVSGQRVSQPVTTGASAGGQTQITSGLNPGDRVVERVVRFNSSGLRNILGGRTGGGGGGGLGGGRGGLGGGGLGGGGLGGGGVQVRGGGSGG